MASVTTNTHAAHAGAELFSIDVFGTIRRRKWIGIGVAIAGIGLSIAGALLYPPTYESSATILIEEPDVPDDLVKTTVSTYADDRLQVIQQRVMTTQNLSDIIDRFGLYQDQLAITPRSELVNMLRSKVDLEVISANFSGQPKASSDRPQATIAFTVAYQSGNPKVAQQVASRISDLYLAENAQSRQEKAAGTTEFLTQQSKQLYTDLTDLEKKITEFRTKNSGSLPEQLQVNMQILAQVQDQMMQNRRDASALSEKKAFLQSQLGEVNPYLPMTAGGQPATPQAQLMSLQLQYIDLSAKYGAKHPQVVHLQKQIDSLKAEVGTTGAVPSGQAELSALQAKLADALQRYGEKHPEVQRLRKAIADLTANLAMAPSQSLISTPKGPPDNPMYLQLQNQLGDVNAQIQGLQTQTVELQKKLEDLQQRVLQTPALQGEYIAMQQQYDAAVKRYQDFRDKQADAQVAETMEQQSKSETFSVIQAPEFPETPVKPNRKLLLAAGIVLSFMFGVGLMVAVELLDSRVYEPRGLMLAFEQAPLASVPYISTQRERVMRRSRYALIALLIVAAIAGGIAAVDAYVMPLDVLIAAFAQRMNF